MFLFTHFSFNFVSLCPLIYGGLNFMYICLKIKISIFFFFIMVPTLTNECCSLIVWQVTSLHEEKLGLQAENERLQERLQHAENIDDPR